MANQILIIRFHHTNSQFKITNNITCKDSNVIYTIECRKCKVESVGSTITTFRARSRGWRSDINLNKKIDKVISHFNRKDPVFDRDFRMTPFEKVFGNEDNLRIRERMYIDRYDLIDNGLNTKRT